MEQDDGVLVIRRIHVVYHLKADSAHVEAVEVGVMDSRAAPCVTGRGPGATTTWTTRAGAPGATTAVVSAVADAAASPGGGRCDEHELGHGGEKEHGDRFPENAF